MTINLYEQYECIEDEVRIHYDFIKKVIPRLLWPPTYVKAMYWFANSMWNKKYGKTRSTREGIFSKKLANLIYNETEKKTEYFTISSSPFPLHELSLHIEKKFPDFAYKHLLRIHERSDMRIKAGNPAKLIGVVLAAGSLLLKTVPRPVVESFDVEYSEYQIVSFWIFIGALFYVSLFLGLWYYTWGKRNRLNRLIKEVIEYTVARQEAENPPSP